MKLKQILKNKILLVIFLPFILYIAWVQLDSGHFQERYFSFVRIPEGIERYTTFFEYEPLCVHNCGKPKLILKIPTRITVEELNTIVKGTFADRFGEPTEIQNTFMPFEPGDKAYCSRAEEALVTRDYKKQQYYGLRNDCPFTETVWTFHSMWHFKKKPISLGDILLPLPGCKHLIGSGYMDAVASKDLLLPMTLTFNCY